MNDQVMGVKASGMDTARSPTPAIKAPDQAPAEPAVIKPGAKRVDAPEQVEAKPAKPVSEPISLEELAEKLRKVNLTFDLFEIEAKYSIDQEAHRIRITLRNTRTGEVIRRIPPTEFLSNVAQLKDSVGLLYNRSL